MNNSLLKEILAQLGSGEIVPYLGQGVLRGVVDRDTGKPIPAVNAGKTRADDLLSLKLELPAQEVLPRLVDLLSVPAA